MNNEMLRDLRSRDYLEKKDFYLEDNQIQSRLICGEHNKVNPLVTIVLPTFRRPDLLKRAIYSAIHQIGFDNYQLLIVDNDPVFDQITDTEKLIRSFQSDKIIYYKNEENLGIYGNWNRAILLARSEWICIINDDDIMVLNHLATMMKVIQENKKIDFLSCQHIEMDFRVNPNLKVDEVMQPKQLNEVRIRKMDYFDYNYGFVALLLGAVFKKSCAMDIGGIRPKTIYANEDYIFVTKFAYYYQVYECKMGLYGYYWGANQSMNVSIWNDSLIQQYYLYRHISRQRKKPFRYLYIKRSQYMIMHLVDTFIDGTGFTRMKCEIDKKEFAKNCGFRSAHVIIFIRKLNTALIKMLHAKTKKNTMNYVVRL